MPAVAAKVQMAREEIEKAVEGPFVVNSLSRPTRYVQEGNKGLKHIKSLYRVTRRKLSKNAETSLRDSAESSSCTFCEFVNTTNKRKCYEVILH